MSLDSALPNKKATKLVEYTQFMSMIQQMWNMSGLGMKKSQVSSRFHHRHRVDADSAASVTAHRSQRALGATWVAA